MPTHRIEAAEDHLARIVGSKPINGVAELIWNALDADATVVKIDLFVSELGGLERVVVADNGSGFPASDVDGLFGRVGGSWKHSVSDRKTRLQKRMLHGDKGEGRWKAFSIGESCKWESVSADEIDGLNHLVTVRIEEPHLGEYEWTGPGDTKDTVGTRVSIDVGGRRPTQLLSENAAPELTAILALYLTMYPDVGVAYNGNDLDVRSLVRQKSVIEIDYLNPYGMVELVVLEWSIPMERALFLCDENGATLHQMSAGIHAPGYEFSAYVRWAGFRAFESLLPLADLDSREISGVIELSREALRQHFRDRQVSDRKTIVQEWQDEDVYPYLSGETVGPMEEAEQALFNFVAVTAADAVNRIVDITAKRFSLATIRVAVERDPGSLELVFREILRLPETKLEELRELIERTSLTGIIDATRMVTNRLELINSLQTLLFDDEHAPKVLERSHLHKIIEGEPWLFGEEFATHVSDRSLTSLLEAHREILGHSGEEVESVTDEQGRFRRIDFMFGRSLETNRSRREHLVVEIKRPTVVLGRKEMDQIEDYMGAVISASAFDVDSTAWDFILIGTSMDEVVRRRITQENKPKGLMLDNPDARVWVRTWAEILDGCRHRLGFIREHLKYDPTMEQAVGYLRREYPEYLPEHLSRVEDVVTGGGDSE